MKFRSSSGQVYSSVALKQCKILFNVMSSGCCHVSTFFPAWALVFGLQLLVHVFSTNCRVIFYWFFPKCLFISLIPWVVNYSCGATWLFTETLKGWGIMQKWMRSKKKKGFFCWSYTYISMRFFVEYALQLLVGWQWAINR